MIERVSRLVVDDGFVSFTCMCGSKLRDTSVLDALLSHVEHCSALTYTRRYEPFVVPADVPAGE